MIIWLWSGLRDVISLKCKSNLWGLVTFSMKKNQRFQRSLPLSAFSRDPAKGFRNHLYFENKVDPITQCKMRVMWLTDHASPLALLTIFVHPLFSWPNYTLLWNWGAISCYSPNLHLRNSGETDVRIKSVTPRTGSADLPSICKGE